MAVHLMGHAWENNVRSAFPDQWPRILSALQAHPDPVELGGLFADLARRASVAVPADAPNASKKRKRDENGTVAPQANGTASATITNPTVSFECADVSFQVPARKKLKLQFVADPEDRTRTEIRLLHPQSNQVEHVLPFASIDQAFCLPVPEKAQRQWNFVLFPKPGATAADGTPCEQIVFSLSETAPKLAQSAERQYSEEDSYVSVTRTEMDGILQQYGKRVTLPTDAEFASSIPQPHRKGEKAYHVKAHRGSKDGASAIPPPPKP